MAKITVELAFPSGLKDEPVIHQMSTNFKIIPNIIEASFSTEMGWAILTLEGDEEEINRLLTYLRTKNVEIKQR